ncbi:ubiquinone anaerobic biosynthesis accessory factor UbiT [Gilvimarinus polysaccharolyticus]|uniref:ubiquinone anaerobic biosynthesis accessory factor UbiT n=1 Tax=Gilvimarinus polysaccharolyticus TaxID=863921 RepID=UPI0006732EAB|nr:SCP2 sterol-binding domain-containing protein [Gilvimarinus polysaccharolyticus]
MTAIFNLLRLCPDPRIAIRLAPNIIPAAALNKIAQAALNRLFNTALKAGDLEFLQGRTVRITVSDIAVDLSLTAADHQLQITTANDSEDVTLRAQSAALLEIIMGQTDPDTLFFRRQLAISGNTELGVQLKNFLDTCEPQEVIPKPLYQALARYLEVQSLAAQP